MESKAIAARIRMDKGSETGVLATMHVWLRSNHNDTDNPCDTVIYGKSTSNQVNVLLRFDFQSFFKEGAFSARVFRKRFISFTSSLIMSFKI